jgi:type I restriction enzyme S subunit
LLEAKRERKAALMQRMLTGKVRLPEFAGQEWKSTQLGKISTILKKEPLSDLSGECLLTVKLHCKGIEKNERITPKLSEKGRSYFKRNAGEFIIGRQNFHNGGFGIVPVELDGLIASSAITSIKIDDQKALKEFVLYYFSREEYYIKAGDRIGGTGQKEFSDKELRSLPIKLPSLKEQTCIAAILSAADLEITQLEQKLEAIREQKKGLMQQLLTGKKRVNIQNKEAA